MNKECLSYLLTEEERKHSKDDMVVEHLYGRCDPIRRQLLGAAVRYLLNLPTPHIHLTHLATCPRLRIRTTKSPIPLSPLSRGKRGRGS